MQKSKRGNKKILVLALLLLLVVVSYSTYSIYKSNSEGTSTVPTANWSVKVNGSDMETKTFTFTESDIVWTDTNSAVAGKIAPGAKGTITIEIDATGSEVPVAYTATLGQVKVANTNIDNNNFTVTAAEGSSLTGTIAYAASNMKKTIVLEVEWTANDNDATNGANDKDKAMAGQEVTIPVTVIAQQAA